MAASTVPCRQTEQNSGCCSKVSRKGIPRCRQQLLKPLLIVTRHLTKRAARLVSLAHFPFPIQFWFYTSVIDMTHLILYNGKEPEGCLTAALAVLVNAELDGSKKSLKGSVAAVCLPCQQLLNWMALLFSVERIILTARIGAILRFHDLLLVFPFSLWYYLP